MPRTIRCIQCGVPLTLPESAAGRRLKCPKCGAKFHPDVPDPSASSSTLGVADAALDSTLGVAPPRGEIDLPTASGVRRARGGGDRDLPNSSGLRPRQASDADLATASGVRPAKGHGDPDLPTASGDLRDTFDAPLLVEDDAPSRPMRPEADALALFQDKPNGKRRLGAAEARAHARRCPTCGGVVPAGMSLCLTCGLNLETGQRNDYDDDLLPPPVIRQAGAPMGVWIVGGLCFLGSIILTLIALIRLIGEEDGLRQNGFELLAVVCVFGIFASVQFLRGKSAKLLLIALALGALTDVVALIALPILEANNETKVVASTVNSGDDEEFVIESVLERLDTNRLTVGILGLVTYAAVSVYLTSPGVRRHFVRREAFH